MALQRARRGDRLALTGRRREKLQEVKEAALREGAEAVLCFEGSVTDQTLVRSHYASIDREWGGLDEAILNAGVGDSRNARDPIAENYRWTFETNVFGVVNWIEAVIPGMIAQRSGVIAAIASIAAFKGLPSSGAYCASKAALRTLLESTRIDLRGTGVDVVTVCPGFVRSELTDRNDPKDMFFLMETSDGVKKMLDGIDRRSRIVVFPWQLTLLMRFIAPHAPGWLYESIVGRFTKRRKKAYVDPVARP